MRSLTALSLIALVGLSYQDELPGFDGDVILVQDKSLSWNQARQHCIALGGDLARPKDIDQNSAIHNFVLVEVDFTSVDYYIGLTAEGYSQGDYRWVDGDTPADINYTLWGTGEPKTEFQCASKTSSNGQRWSSTCCDCLPNGDDGHMFVCDILPTPAPSSIPTPMTTRSPTSIPTSVPTPVSTGAPTSTPTYSPTPVATDSPTPTPTSTPTLSPTSVPTPIPTSLPTPSPTYVPSPNPTSLPTPSPTSLPSPSPTNIPTPSPTNVPSPVPTNAPTPSPTNIPTPSPTNVPSPVPTNAPTALPTASPTPEPTSQPTASPTAQPTSQPTATPTPQPTSQPTSQPTASPTPQPTSQPTQQPTAQPSPSPTNPPTSVPTPNPTSSPTTTPTSSPTPLPTSTPTPMPTLVPTPSPTNPPTSVPTPSPTSSPTSIPTNSPTPQPTSTPTPQPTSTPTPMPTLVPTPTPTDPPADEGPPELQNCKFGFEGRSWVTPFELPRPGRGDRQLDGEIIAHGISGYSSSQGVRGCNGSRTFYRNDAGEWQETWVDDNGRERSNIGIFYATGRNDFNVRTIQSWMAPSLYDTLAGRELRTIVSCRAFVDSHWTTVNSCVPFSVKKPREYTCENQCGDFNSHRACQCDAVCSRHGDCCVDYTEMCAAAGILSTESEPHETNKPFCANSGGRALMMSSSSPSMSSSWNRRSPREDDRHRDSEATAGFACCRKQTTRRTSSSSSSWGGSWFGGDRNRNRDRRGDDDNDRSSIECSIGPRSGRQSRQCKFEAVAFEDAVEQCEGMNREDAADDEDAAERWHVCSSDEFQGGACCGDEDGRGCLRGQNEVWVGQA